MLVVGLIGLVGGLVLAAAPSVRSRLPTIVAGADAGPRQTPSPLPPEEAALTLGGAVGTVPPPDPPRAALLSPRWRAVQQGVVATTPVALVAGATAASVAVVLSLALAPLGLSAGARTVVVVVVVTVAAIVLVVPTAVPDAVPVLLAAAVAGLSEGGEVRSVVPGALLALGTVLGAVLGQLAAVRGTGGPSASSATAARAVGAVVWLALAVTAVVDARGAAEPDDTPLPGRPVATASPSQDPRAPATPGPQGALAPFATDENRGLDRCTPGADRLADCGPAPALRGIGRWFNTPGASGPTLARLRGRVVLVDFFSAACATCRREAPTVQRWAETYAGAGLTVVGVHAPEYGFERSGSYVGDALRRAGITFPVATDDDLATFRAYRNRYWPATYLIDRAGTVRALSFGGGARARTEQLLRRLLSEDGSALPPVVVGEDDPGDAEALARRTSRDRTPQLYLGTNLPGYVGRPRYVTAGRASYSYARDGQPVDSYGLEGTWLSERESLTATDDSRLQLAYRGRGLEAVLTGRGTVTVRRPGRPDAVVRLTGRAGPTRLIDAAVARDETVELVVSAGVRVYALVSG